MLQVDADSNLVGGCGEDGGGQGGVTVFVPVFRGRKVWSGERERERHTEKEKERERERESPLAA